jgi:hypothetical protein
MDKPCTLQYLLQAQLREKPGLRPASSTGCPTTQGVSTPAQLSYPGIGRYGLPV